MAVLAVIVATTTTRWSALPNGAASDVIGGDFDSDVIGEDYDTIPSDLFGGLGVDNY